jgi:hypothetical protein
MMTSAASDKHLLVGAGHSANACVHLITIASAHRLLTPNSAPRQVPDIISMNLLGYIDANVQLDPVMHKEEKTKSTHRVEHALSIATLVEFVLWAPEVFPRLGEAQEVCKHWAKYANRPPPVDTNLFAFIGNLVGKFAATAK